MASGSNPRPKPWETVGASSGPAPFKPPSGGSTTDVFEASGTARHGEVVSTTGNNVTSNVNNSISRPMPPRPWQQQGYGTSYGGYGSNMYSSYSGFGGAYNNSGLYGNNMYSGYGGGYGGMYGGSMYNSGVGGPCGGYGMGLSPYNQGPNSFGPPAPPPGFWVSFLRVVSFDRYYCLHSYVIGVECSMLSLRDLFYVFWGSKQNQRRVVFSTLKLHHWRDQASSLLMRQKLTTHGTVSGLRRARGSKGPICVQ